MKHLFPLAAICGFFLYACSSAPREVTEGTVVYAIDYPNHKDNFFLYSILPKEMSLHFKDGKMGSHIEKANLTNILLVDCNQKKVATYFRYGDEAFYAHLNPQDISMMIADQTQYTIRYTDEKDTLAGFNVQKAVATAVKNPSDKIDLWYTNEIRLPHSNWYNPFKDVNGFLLAYSIDRYGIRMNFRAVSYQATKISDAQLELPDNGESILFAAYNQKLGELFQSFE